MTPTKPKPKIVFTINISDPSIKDLAKLVSGIGIAIVSILGYFHFDNKSGQTEIRSEVAAVISDTTKIPRGQMGAKLERLNNNDSAIMARLDSIDKRAAIMMDFLQNISKANNQNSTEAIAMHNRDSVRIDLLYSTFVTLLPIIKR